MKIKLQPTNFVDEFFSKSNLFLIFFGLSIIIFIPILLWYVKLRKDLNNQIDVDVKNKNYVKITDVNDSLSGLFNLVDSQIDILYAEILSNFNKFLTAKENELQDLYEKKFDFDTKLFYSKIDPIISDKSFELLQKIQKELSLIEDKISEEDTKVNDPRKQQNLSKVKISELTQKYTELNEKYINLSNFYNDKFENEEKLNIFIKELIINNRQKSIDTYINNEKTNINSNINIKKQYTDFDTKKTKVLSDKSSKVKITDNLILKQTLSNLSSNFNTYKDIYDKKILLLYTKDENKQETENLQSKLSSLNDKYQSIYNNPNSTLIKDIYNKTINDKFDFEDNNVVNLLSDISERNGVTKVLQGTAKGFFDSFQSTTQSKLNGYKELKEKELDKDYVKNDSEYSTLIEKITELENKNNLENKINTSIQNSQSISTKIYDDFTTPLTSFISNKNQDLTTILSKKITNDTYNTYKTPLSKKIDTLIENLNDLFDNLFITYTIYKNLKIGSINGFTNTVNGSKSDLVKKLNAIESTMKSDYETKISEYNTDIRKNWGKIKGNDIDELIKTNYTTLLNNDTNDKNILKTSLQNRENEYSQFLKEIIDKIDFSSLLTKNDFSSYFNTLISDSGIINYLTANNLPLKDIYNSFYKNLKDKIDGKISGYKKLLNEKLSLINSSYEQTIKNYKKQVDDDIYNEITKNDINNIIQKQIIEDRQTELSNIETEFKNQFSSFLNEYAKTDAFKGLITTSDGEYGKQLKIVYDNDNSTVKNYLSSEISSIQNNISKLN